MPIPDIQVVPVRSRSELRQFVTFPWKVYSGDPNWTPPLIRDAMKLFDAKHHPFHRHAEVQCFLARRGGGRRPGEIVGRVAAILNRAHNEFHGEKTGFFGFFESLPDPSVPPFLLQTAGRWLRERGIDRMRGPANFSSNEDWGLLIDGFDRPAMVMMPYNPPAYARYLEDFGAVKVKDLVAYHMESATPIPERFLRVASEIEAGGEVRVRPLNMKRFREEVERVREVYNSAWERNWGFIPMTAEEIDHMAKELKPVVDPDYVVFAELNGQVVGFALALPDLNLALRAANGRLWPLGLLKMLRAARRIRELRVLTLGVVEEYRRKRIDALLYLYLWRTGTQKGITGGEFSWILEDNLPMRRALDRMGARVYKTYRLYDYPLV